MTLEEADKLLDANPVWRVETNMVATIGSFTLVKPAGSYMTDRATLRQLLAMGYKAIRPATDKDYFVQCPCCDTVFEVKDAVLRRRQEQLAPPPRLPSARAVSHQR